MGLDNHRRPLEAFNVDNIEKLADGETEGTTLSWDFGPAAAAFSQALKRQLGT